MPRELVEHFSGCVCEGVSQRDYTCISGLSKDQFCQRRWASCNPLTAWIEEKGRGQVNCSLLERRPPSSPALKHQAFRPRAGLTPSASRFLSGAFGLGLHRTSSFPGSLTCKWQIMRLLGRHNHMSQFLLIYLHIYNLLLVRFLWRTLTNTPSFSYSLESRHTGWE